MIIERWSRALFAPPARRQAVTAFEEQYGCRPPWFLVLSPGYACNLACPGCYASSGAGAARLPWSTLDRVMCEAKELWPPGSACVNGIRGVLESLRDGEVITVDGYLGIVTVGPPEFELEEVPYQGGSV